TVDKRKVDLVDAAFKILNDVPVGRRAQESGILLRQISGRGVNDHIVLGALDVRRVTGGVVNKRVGAAAADEQIAGQPADQNILAGRSGDHNVYARKSVQIIVAGAANQDVFSVVAEIGVVATGKVPVNDVAGIVSKNYIIYTAGVVNALGTVAENDRVLAAAEARR